MLPATTPATGEDQLTALLEGDFLLTDARGSISRFGPRASALFGWSSEEILGRQAIESLAVPGTADAWRERLKTSADPPAGIVQGRARHLGGQEFDIEWLAVPVWLRDSLELSRMLEVVSAEGGAETKLSQLERNHGAALAAVRAAAAGKTPEVEDRLAGLVLTFRALDETPWADAALERKSVEPEPAAAVVAPGDEQLARVGKLESEVEMLHGQLAELRAELSLAHAAAAGAGAASEDIATVRDEVAAARAASERALAVQHDATAARATAEQALALAEETHMEAERWHRELAERARAESAEADTRPAPRLQGREELPGFDNVEQPLAVIALDGRFEQLNPAFCDLVGYTEREFRRARWPSLADRDNVIEHRRQHARLAAGELEEIRIDTVYLHGQGLLVPVHGTLELVREAGRPGHLLLRVDS